MKKLLAVCLLTIPTVAIAQTAPPIPDKEFTLKVSANEINTIGKGLGQLPYNEVMALMIKLQSQLAEQSKSASNIDVNKPSVQPSKTEQK